MKSLVLILAILFISADFSLSQRSQILDALQVAMNDYCISHPNHQGCHKKPAKEAIMGPEGCPALTRRCPQRDDICLPQELPCTILDSRDTCSYPSGSGITVQTIFCGSGKIGVSCGVNKRVPLLSVIAVQCKQRSSSFVPSSVNSLQSFEFEGKTEGGAGIYRCLPGNQWEALYENSPFLNTLVESCYYAGCGRLPSPRGDRAPKQHWAWLRSLMDFNSNVLCTATLVSPNSLVTAAHCVTESLTSTFPVDTQSLRISVPLDNIDQVVQISSIHIHPDYVAGDLRQNDIAVIKFDNVGGATRPHACLPRTAMQNPTPPGVVFKYDTFFQNWVMSDARYSATCRSSQGRTCSTPGLQGQFCARQSRFELEPRSSGGPYLINLVPGTLDYTWAVLGIYSREHRASSSCNPNSVFVNTMQHIDWLRQCVLLDFCQSAN